MCNKRSHYDEKSTHCNEEQRLFTATRESQCAAMNNQHNQNTHTQKHTHTNTHTNTHTQTHTHTNTHTHTHTHTHIWTLGTSFEALDKSFQLSKLQSPRK